MYFECHPVEWGKASPRVSAAPPGRFLESRRHTSRIDRLSTGGRHALTIDPKSRSRGDCDRRPCQDGRSRRRLGAAMIAPWMLATATGLLAMLAVLLLADRRWRSARARIRRIEVVHA